MIMRNDLAQVQNILDYRFSEFENLELALTAAGADEANHDGNRRMAQMGEKLIEFLLAEAAYAAGASRAHINENVTSAVARKHRENIAKTVGIAPFVRCCPRQGDESPSRAVLSLAVCAIVWACWLDSARDVDVVHRLLHHLGFGLPSGSCLDPREALTQGRALQEPSYNLLRLDQPSTGDMLCSSAGLSSANTAALSSLVGFDTIETRQRDVSDNESDERMRSESPFRGPNLCSFATSPCLSAMELDTRVPTSVETHTSHPEVLQEESSQQPQEGEGNENRPSKFNRPMNSIAGSIEDASCSASRSQPRTKRTTHETHRHRIEKSAQPYRSSHKPAQSIRKLVRRDNRHETSTEKSSGQEEDRDEASTEQDNSEINACILEGKRRYDSLGYDDTNLLGSEQAKRLLASVSSDKQVLALRSLLVAVGGCDSLMSLKNILQAYRESHKSNSPAHANISSNAERVEIIKRLGEKAAYCTFLRYCHIHKLFVDNSKLRRNTTDNFINSNATSIAAQSSRGRGNPVTAMEAKITKSMMQEVYPHIEPTHSHYQSRYREMTSWRRAGRRLEQLVSGFNHGVLGLLPLVTYNLNLVENMYGNPVRPLSACTDPIRIFHLPDDKFQLFIEILAANAGGFLQDLGSAATPIVVGIFENSIDTSNTFSIEDTDDDDIMGCPKGSPRLLELISSAATPLPSAIA
ncbi:hypothetical protein XANCAGTX0491_005546 [Xanthoria calcicola]